MKIKLARLDYIAIFFIIFSICISIVVVDNFCMNGKTGLYQYLYKDRIIECYMDEWGFNITRFLYWLSIISIFFILIKYLIFNLKNFLKFIKDINSPMK